MTVDLGYACPACGSREGFVSNASAWNCWQCVSCEMISAIKNDCLELIPTRVAGRTEADQQMTFAESDKTDRGWAASNRAFCNWVHRRYEHEKGAS